MIPVFGSEHSINLGSLSMPKIVVKTLDQVKTNGVTPCDRKEQLKRGAKEEKETRVFM